MMILLGIIPNSCSPKNEKVDRDYSDYENITISWENVFFAAKSQYFVYIFSETCGHCIAIKDDILTFADEEEFPIYLVQFSEDIPVTYSVEDTIGATNIENLSILGTPTLIEIDEGVVVKNVAGAGRIIPLLYSKKK